MNGIGSRIRQARKAKGMTLDALAVACGWEGAGRISNYESGRRPPGIDDLMLIAVALGVPFVWLATGIPQIGDAEAETGMNIGTKVPVIDLPSASVVLTDKTASPATMAYDWKNCPVTHGTRTFAYRVADDAMTAAGGPKSYPAGCYVFVDPDVTTPQHDKPVLARLPGGGILLANYMSQAGRVWLRQLNPAYPPVTGEFEVAGVVIGKWEEP